MFFYILREVCVGFETREEVCVISLNFRRDQCISLSFLFHFHKNSQKFYSTYQNITPFIFNFKNSYNV